MTLNEWVKQNASLGLRRDAEALRIIREVESLVEEHEQHRLYLTEATWSRLRTCVNAYREADAAWSAFHKATPTMAIEYEEAACNTTTEK